MRSLTPAEQNKLLDLKWPEGSFALVEPTATGLKKKLFDATRGVREYLNRIGYHDFERQAKGDKVEYTAYLVTEKGIVESGIGLNRPPSGNGDPRIRITGLTKLAKPNDIVALAVRGKRMYVLNLSGLSLEHLRTLPAEGLASQPERGGLLNHFDPPLPDLDYAASEGGKNLRVHLVRERDRAIVERKKKAFKRKHGRLNCEACDFDFEKTYGTHGADFIECHHVVPLASRAASEKTRLKDLVLLCSNCHRVVHRKSAPLTMERLREILRDES